MIDEIQISEEQSVDLTEELSDEALDRPGLNLVCHSWGACRSSPS